MNKLHKILCILCLLSCVLFLKAQRIENKKTVKKTKFPTLIFEPEPIKKVKPVKMRVKQNNNRLKYTPVPKLKKIRYREYFPEKPLNTKMDYSTDYFSLRNFYQ